MPNVPHASDVPDVDDAAALRELVHTLERFPSLFALNADAVALYNRRGTIVAGNAASRALIGGKLRGAHFARHLDPAEVDRDAARFKTALSGEPVAFESIFLTLDGVPINVLARLVPALDNGRIIGVFGVARDITQRRRAEASRDESRQEFQSLFEQHPDSISMLDASGRYQRLNAAAERLTGYRSQEIAGRKVGIILPAGEGDAINTYALEVIAEGKATRYERTFARKDGSQGVGEGIAVPIVVDDRVTGLFLMSRDVTERTRSTQALALQARRTGALYRLASAMGANADVQADAALAFGLKELGFEAAFVVTQQDEELTIRRRVGKDLHVAAGDPCFRQLFRETIAGSSLLEVDGPALAARWGSAGGACAFCRSFLGIPLDIESGRYGALGFASSSPTAGLTDFDREFVRAVAELAAVSIDRASEERRLVGLANFDALTALPNRLLLSDRFKGAIALARRRDEHVAVYFIDIDKFKTINDTLGHHAGDQVLRAVARRLLDACRASDTVARLGGDEFVVLHTGPLTGKQIDDLAARLRSELGAPCVIDGMQVNLSVGIGISVFPRDGDDEKTLLKNADTALYAAKARGASSISRFGVKAAAAIQIGPRGGTKPR